jgi:hypothetical protein
MQDFKEVIGSQKDRPEELEINVDTVYIRKNIERISITEEDGSVVALWKYLEKQMTMREYAQMKASEGA